MNKCIERAIQLGVYSLVLVCASCSQNDTESTTVDDGPQIHVQEGDTVSSAEGKTLEQQISDAVVDLATRTGFAADTIIVNDAGTVNWRSGAVGCPRAGMNYTQAIVPGVRLLLEADGTIYYYHGRKEASLMYCPAERAEAPAFEQDQEAM